jgi:hypothetical protein
VSRAWALAAAGLLAAAPAAADRTGTRFTQELDSAELHHGFPYAWRLSTRYDLYLADFTDRATGDDYDFAGRKRKMAYDLEPISTMTLAARYALRFSEFGEPVYLDAAYGTSRLFGGAGDAGEADTGPLRALGFDDAASTVLDVGLEYFGLAGRIAWQSFRAGRARVVDAKGGGTLESRPLNLDHFTGRLVYDFRPIELFEEVDGRWRPWRPFGFTLFVQLSDYTLPRILNQVRERAHPGPDDARYVYVDETDPQDVRTRTYELGGTAIVMLLRSQDLSFTGHLELGGSFGAGSTAFDFHGRRRTQTVLAGEVDTSALVTLRHPIGEALLELSLQYNFELRSWFTPEHDGTYFDPATLDAFHGPRVELIARF